MSHPVLYDEVGDGRRDALEAELAVCEREVAALKRELQELQRHYLGQLGGLYAELSELEAAVADEEIRAGLRPEKPLESADAVGDEPASPGTSAAAASDDLKRIFRDVAKSVHPDLALDEPARCRRHSLMAEANRAYAERDADRLRLILQAWERDPDLARVDARGSARPRRRTAELEERLAALRAEMADLRRSAIFKLKQKIEKTRREGWDLFGEMILQVRSDIARARARLNAFRAGKP
jgi:hypothetical protein